MNNDKRYYFILRFLKLFGLIGSCYCDQTFIKASLYPSNIIYCYN